ncbi:MAG: hypothetical protein SOR11_02820 [Fusobacterium sp.]|uniref:hypothetical protein n=1 Tax=Fusobacterium sp. TaxID=68766 RepID=UPI002A753B20|nr:hypothetical protein [Fusobacterium sp.]MDY3058917.1 hypothetical protein [Fusobacterium sp.]
MGIKEIWQEIKYTNSYYKKIMLGRIFSGIGVVFFITSLRNFNLEIFIKISVGILIGILFIIKNYTDEQIKEVLIRQKAEEKAKEKLQKEKEQEIRLWFEGSRDINRLVLAVISLGTAMINLNPDVKRAEKIEILREFLKDIENFYEIKEETKLNAEKIFKSNPDILEITKELKDLKLSIWVKNKINNLLWQIIYENGNLGTEEEKLLNDWQPDL